MYLCDNAKVHYISDDVGCFFALFSSHFSCVRFFLSLPLLNPYSALFLHQWYVLHHSYSQHETMRHATKIFLILSLSLLFSSLSAETRALAMTAKRYRHA